MKIYEAAMIAACVKALDSPDPSTQNGAVLINGSGDILAMGCNEFPRGVAYHDERWERPLKYSIIEHAERNAIFAAARFGYPCDGMTLVCPYAACADCARAIVQAGIKTLVTLPRRIAHTNARWSETVRLADRMLLEAGVDLTFYTGPLATPLLRRDGQLMRP